MGCGTSKLTGESFDNIDVAHKPKKTMKMPKMAFPGAAGTYRSVDDVGPYQARTLMLDGKVLTPKHPAAVQQRIPESSKRPAGSLADHGAREKESSVLTQEPIEQTQSHHNHAPHQPDKLVQEPFEQREDHHSHRQQRQESLTQQPFERYDSYIDGHAPPATEAQAAVHPARKPGWYERYQKSKRGVPEPRDPVTGRGLITGLTLEEIRDVVYKTRYAGMFGNGTAWPSRKGSAQNGMVPPPPIGVGMSAGW